MQGNSGEDSSALAIQSLLAMNNTGETAGMTSPLENGAQPISGSDDGQATVGGMQLPAGNAPHIHANAAARWQSLPWAQGSRKV